MAAVFALPQSPRQRQTALMVALWISQPFAAGELIGTRLADVDNPFRSTVSIAAWLLWAAVLAAMAVPRPVTLTIVRVGTIGGFVAAIWAAAGVETSITSTVDVVVAAVAVLVTLLPGVGDRFVDGVSYGDEQRFLLKAPGVALMFLVGPTTAAVLGGLAIGPLLLADTRWVLGALAVVIGFPVAWFAINALHALTSRFIVFVPNGVVVHDPTTLLEPVLFVSREIAGLGPARRDTAGTDLTNQALGLALELRLNEPVTVSMVTGRGEAEEQVIRSLLFSPTRPATLLRVAADRGLPIA